VLSAAVTSGRGPWRTVLYLRACLDTPGNGHTQIDGARKQPATESGVARRLVLKARDRLRRRSGAVEWGDANRLRLVVEAVDAKGNVRQLTDAVEPECQASRARHGGIDAAPAAHALAQVDERRLDAARARMGRCGEGRVKGALVLGQGAAQVERAATGAGTWARDGGWRVEGARQVPRVAFDLGEQRRRLGVGGLRGIVRRMSSAAASPRARVTGNVRALRRGGWGAAGPRWRVLSV
jgi:hypothetical protein